MNKCRELFDDTEDISIRSLSIASDSSKLIAGNSAGICYVWNSVNGTDFVPLQEIEAHHD